MRQLLRRAAKTKTTKRSLSSKRQAFLIVAAFAVIGSILLYRSFAATTGLTGDLNSDGQVNMTDLNIMLGDFNKSSSVADLNTDGQVNVYDMSMLLSNYGKTGSVTPNPPPPPPGPNPNPNPNPNPPSGNAQYPADIVGKDWKVTLPVVEDGKVVEIKPPEFDTYTDKYFHLNDTKDGVIFDCWHGGGTTSNSSNPRSELRERYNDDPEGYWNAGSGTHTMEVVGQVNRLTKVKPHVVIAQVHDADDDVSVWRVEGNQLWLTNGDETHGHLVDDNFQLNKKYTVKYVITNGNYEYFYNGTKVDFTLSNSKESYFKAGNYLQSNPESAPDESSDEYSEVVIYSVKVTHS
jgi:hypothetical protein